MVRAVEFKQVTEPDSNVLIDDECIHYDGGRVAANESLKAEISANGLRETTKETGLDRKTIRALLKGKIVNASTPARVMIGLRKE